MRESPASTGTIVTLRHESEVLNGNPLGDKNVREVIIYLPPDYNKSGSDYPSVYCLSGFAGRGRMQLNDSAFVPNLAERMDRLIAAGSIQPMIVVLPDCFTYYGGSQYVNSTATGQYGDYLTQEIVPFVDGLFRTRRDPSARAVMGKSSGGYGSLIMGMRHPDLFGLVASISGDAYFEYCYPGDFAKAFRAIKADIKGFMQRFWEKEKKGKDDFAAVNTIAMSACYSPNGSDLDLPFDLQTGEIRAEVWNRWLEHDPVRLVEKNVENLKSLSLLFLDAGTRDEFGLDLGARILSKRLTDFSIRHIHEEFDDGHFNVSYRYDRSLELISNFCQRA